MTVEEIKDLIKKYKPDVENAPKGIAVTAEQFKLLLKAHVRKPSDPPHGLYTGIPIVVVLENDEVPQGYKDMRPKK